MESIIAFAKKHWIYIVIAIVSVISISLLVTKEGFEASENVFNVIASYPAVFEKNVMGNLKLLSFSDLYKSFETKSTDNIALSSIKGLELPATTAVVPLDIGNGNAVNITVEVPPQIVDVPAQMPLDVEAQKTPSELTVVNQMITIPEQTGLIPGKIDESGKQVMIPVVVPEQAVNVEAQNVFQTTMETFKSYY